MTTIKDPVHGYIDFDEFERRVIDTPWFQRLKQIRQNDVSSTVYPTMHTRRFEHSLGAMHVAGACIVAAIQQSDPQHRDRFLRALWADVFSDHPYDPKAAIEAARQIARLHGLLHDVGHPPFSHLLERAIPYASIYPERNKPREGQSAAEFAEKTKKWHELNGVELIRERISSVARTPLEKTYLEIAGRLLENEQLTAALRGVQSLVDAVIDTDRMDFVARDGRASGAEFGHYDIRRLIDSFRIVVDEADGDISAVHIRPSIKALSAVESLLLERHKLYRWVFFHHRVMLSKALTRTIVDVLSGGMREEKLIPADYRVENHYCLTQDRPYGLLGDTYVEAQLWRLLKKLSAPATQQERIAKIALQVLLLRERHSIALWKNKDEYDDFDRRLADRFRGVTVPPDEDAVKTQHGSYANWLGDYVIKHGDRARGFLEKAASRLLQAGKGWFLLEATEGFSTKGRDELISGNNKQAISLGQFSSVVKGVVESWRRDIHLYGFYIELDATKEGTTPARDTFRATLAEALVGVFKDDVDEQRNLRRMLAA